MVGPQSRTIPQAVSGPQIKVETQKHLGGTCQPQQLFLLLQRYWEQTGSEAAQGLLSCISEALQHSACSRWDRPQAQFPGTEVPLATGSAAHTSGRKPAKPFGQEPCAVFLSGQGRAGQEGLPCGCGRWLRFPLFLQRSGPAWERSKLWTSGRRL